MASSRSRCRRLPTRCRGASKCRDLRPSILSRRRCSRRLSRGARADRPAAIGRATGRITPPGPVSSAAPGATGGAAGAGIRPRCLLPRRCRISPPSPRAPSTRSPTSRRCSRCSARTRRLRTTRSSSTSSDGDMFGERSRRELSLGSGVVVSADGYILTNVHVLGPAGARHRGPRGAGRQARAARAGRRRRRRDRHRAR